jgi:diguanylate cyclase (GGDEF)-like protein/PAS domain S-box-containing protein
MEAPIDPMRHEFSLKRFVEEAPLQIAMFDRDMRYLAASGGWVNVYLLPERYVGLSHYDLFPDIPSTWKEAHRRALAGEAVSQKDDKFIFSSGEYCWVDLQIAPWRLPDGTVGGIIISAFDVTSRKNGELAISESDSRLRDLFADMPVAYQSLDIRGYWLHANQKMADLLGFKSPDQLIGLNFADFWSDEIRRLPQTPFAKFKRTGSVDGEQTLVRRDGSKVTIMISGRIERDAGGNFVRTHCILMDITERYKMEEQIRRLNAELEQKVASRTAELAEANKELLYLARHDRVTDLPNRLAVEERLQSFFLLMKRSKRTYAVLMIDIDFFKRVNDTFGHAVGDRVLRNVANILRSNLRGSDFVGRYGGEEFLAVLPDTSAQQACNVGAKLREAIASYSDDVVGVTTVSIGVAVSVLTDASADDAVRLADDEMYKAKQFGRNQLSFHASH